MKDLIGLGSCSGETKTIYVGPPEDGAGVTTRISNGIPGQFGCTNNPDHAEDEFEDFC